MDGSAHTIPTTVDHRVFRAMRGRNQGTAAALPYVHSESSLARNGQAQTTDREGKDVPVCLKQNPEIYSSLIGSLTRETKW
jgi:hypothetical protein